MRSLIPTDLQDEPLPPPPRPRARRGSSPLLSAVALLALIAIPLHPGVLLLAAVLGRQALRRAKRQLQARRQARGASVLPANALLLGSDHSGKALLIPDAALAAHGLILGASGSGKSTTMLTILNQQITRGRPVVAIDLKGSPEFANALAQSASDAGRRFRLWTPDGPTTWNPLANGNATELKDKLIATERFTEPHYQRAAERFTQLAIQVLQETRPQRAPALADVVEMLDPAALAAATRTLPRERGEYVRGYLSSLTSDQLSAVRGLASRLAILTESHTGGFLQSGPDPIDLRRSLADGDVVLFSLNSSSYGRLSGQLGTMVIQDLVSAAGARLHGASSPAPALVAIDEFSGLQSDNVMALLARGRASGIGVLLATQELADLERAARGLRDQVLGNTAVKLIHRQDVPESAETVAKMGGTVRVWEPSYQQRGNAFGLTQQRGSSLRLVDRYRIEPNRVSTLGVGELVAIVKSPHASTRLGRVRAPDLGGPSR